MRDSGEEAEENLRDAGVEESAVARYDSQKDRTCRPSAASWFVVPNVRFTTIAK